MLNKIKTILKRRVFTYTRGDECTYQIKTFKCPDCGHHSTKIDEGQPPFIGATNFAVVPMVCNKCSYAFSMTIQGT